LRARRRASIADSKRIIAVYRRDWNNRLGLLWVLAYGGLNYSVNQATPMMSTKRDQFGESSHKLKFGPFRLDIRDRVIDRAGAPLRLGSRARDILTTLLERPGETISKRELIARVWPHTVVDEGTLRVHISALRRALREDSGRHYIENVTGHGYRFVAPVTPGRTTEKVPELVSPLLPLIGRADSISTVMARLPNRRLVTIVGPGGVGKTAVALASADRLRESYPDGVCLVDLAGAADLFTVGLRVAAALAIATDSDKLLPDIIQHLRSRRTLVVLDSCERVVDAVAIVAEEMLIGAPNVNVIATSREPLRTRCEWVLRLDPLDFPMAPSPLTVEQALGFPAIQLFAERAAASLHDFELRDTEVAAVVDICRRLDGLPLAIELAAARVVDLCGVRGLAAGLYDVLGLLTRGYRTAAPRHYSLRAMLAWSYDMLSAVEQIALKKLALFTAPFDLASATAMVIGEAIDATDVLDILANLTAKSLLVADAAGEKVLYRHFETSRAFALEKLERSQDVTEIRRRHDCMKSKSKNGRPF
jgi:predicted ATPase/DNA-binding winged helix-turn-helix (wHTH) protein